MVGIGIGFILCALSLLCYCRRVKQDAPDVEDGMAVASVKACSADTYTTTTTTTANNNVRAGQVGVNNELTIWLHHLTGMDQGRDLGATHPWLDGQCTRSTLALYATPLTVVHLWLCYNSLCLADVTHKSFKERSPPAYHLLQSSVSILPGAQGYICDIQRVALRAGRPHGGLQSIEAAWAFTGVMPHRRALPLQFPLSCDQQPPQCSCWDRPCVFVCR
jgi:hypothetical protein